ncbi:MAG: hypothetical protein LBK71_00055, partial [Verrucomicrobiales bacterium]|nr:hypothetical protein [Verrucomicrobiales bacterium]
MKTPIQKTLTRILTLCALSVCFARRLGVRASVCLLAFFTALNVLAENKVVTTGTVTESDKTYAAVSNQAALQVSGSETFYRGTNLTLSSTVGRSSLYAYRGAAVSLYNTAVTISGSNASGLLVSTSATLTAITGSISTSGPGNTYGINISGSNSKGFIDDYYIHTTGTRGLGIVVGPEAYAEVRHTTVVCDGLEPIIGTPSQAGALTAYNSSTLIFNSGTIISAGNAVTTQSEGRVVLNDSTVETTGHHAALSLERAGGEIIVNGGRVISAGSLLELSGTEGHAVATFNEVDLSQGGGIAMIDINYHGAEVTGTANVNINGGSGITGDVTNSGSGALGLNLDHSALTGDVTNVGDGVLVVTLDNNSIGTGGYHGGDLITGGDSAWTFNKDSHGNYGENNGTWNIGDYEVIFDNMTHTGTVNIHVNSDTGEGGSITVTGTADGAGTVHIDTTGNGKANPNQVLPGKVTGDGTEHWQWDPIDWGIDTIIKDGDHFIKQGTSPAGTVLNSSVAIQQAMWFAQQN